MGVWSAGMESWMNISFSFQPNCFINSSTTVHSIRNQNSK